MKVKEILSSYEEDGSAINDPRIVSAIFRSYYASKQSGTKQKNTDLCKILYNELPERYQSIINQAIDDLLPQEIKQQHFGKYLQYMVESLKDFNGKQISSYQLATFLYAQRECLNKREITSDSDDYTIENIHSKLKSFYSKSKSMESSDSLELDLCDLLCFDASILDTGQGFVHRLNHEKIAEILEKRGIDSAEFYAEVVRQFVECSTCKSHNNCEVKGKYIESKQFDYIGIGKKISEILHIELEEIIEDSYIIIEPESYPWEKYYCKLSKEHQMHINNLIRNLCMMVKSEENK